MPPTCPPIPSLPAFSARSQRKPCSGSSEGLFCKESIKSQQFLEAMTVGWRLVPFISVCKQNMDEHGRQFIWHCILLSHYIAIVWYSGSPNAQTRPAMPLPPTWLANGREFCREPAGCGKGPDTGWGKGPERLPLRLNLRTLVCLWNGRTAAKPRPNPIGFSVPDMLKM